jgi:hypothetical protein
MTCDSESPEPGRSERKACTVAVVEQILGFLFSCTRRGAGGQLRKQRAAIRNGLTHSDDAATADRQTNLTHHAKGLQSVIVGPSSDDLGVELTASIEIVIVGIQSSLLKPSGLAERESMPSVAHASIASPLTIRTISKTMSNCSPLGGCLQPAPMQNLSAPARFAFVAASRTSSVVKRGWRANPVLYRADCER